MTIHTIETMTRRIDSQLTALTHRLNNFQVRLGEVEQFLEELKNDPWFSGTKTTRKAAADMNKEI